MRAFTQAEEMGPADLIIIFGKAPLTRNAPEGMGPLMRDESLVLTLQNGLGNQETIEEVL